MRTAAKLKDGEAVIGEYRAQADGLKPPIGSSDIGCRKPDMADRNRRPLINSLRHDNPFRDSSSSLAQGGLARATAWLMSTDGAATAAPARAHPPTAARAPVNQRIRGSFPRRCRGN